MKIRKILPLVLLALCAVFLLSSCDAMLDFIFSNNTITVYVSARIPWYGYFPNSDYVTVDVAGPTSATATAGYPSNDGLYMYWSVTVPKLSDGNYTVTAYYNHPIGSHTGSPYGVQYVSLPTASGNHSVSMNFDF